MVLKASLVALFAAILATFALAAASLPPPGSTDAGAMMMADAGPAL